MTKIDISNVVEFTSKCSEERAIDLQSIEYIDCAGLQAILVMHKEGFKIMNVSSYIKNMLKEYGCSYLLEQ